MIWLFKVNEVFWNNWNDKPTVNEYYLLNTNDINFDINNYEIPPLYFGTANYYMIEESNSDLVYLLRNNHKHRKMISKDEPIYNIIRDFYITEQRDRKINNTLQ